jgi:hypothetical protein
MKKLLITMHIIDPTDKYWWDCSIKNQVVPFDPEKQSIHDLIKKICEDEGMELSYKGKPQGNMNRDLKTGDSEIIGYVYRGKGKIYDNHLPKPVMVFWDIWVEIHTVEKFEFEEIDC